MSVSRSEVPEEFSEERMTTAQKSYLLDLIEDRVMTEDERKQAFAKVADGLTKKQASKEIERVLKLPKPNSDFNRRSGSLPRVPDGRYAVMVNETVANEDVETLKFFKIKNPTEGRWAGFTFVDAGRGGAHGDLQWTPVKDFAYKSRILRLIARDPKAAGRKFGQEVGVCCRCGRSLTDETSRSAGIGPDCREKGW